MMEKQVYYITQIATIDARLDELIEDFGDLPELLKIKEANYSEKKRIVDETSSLLEELKAFASKAKNILVDLKLKEEKLMKQQFQVRNNREFDAITNEINHLKAEHEKLSAELITNGIKQENITNLLKEQIKEMENAKLEVEEVYAEVERLSGDQKEELERLKKLRKNISENVKSIHLKDYDRIRKMHSDAAVRIKKNSCSGCFSSLPAQLIVEVRSNLDKLYFCESCGRILIPDEEELFVEDIINN